MSLLGAFKHKQDASFNIEPAYEPETEAKGELDFVKIDPSACATCVSVFDK